MIMKRGDIAFFSRVALSLIVGFLVAYPLFLYGRHFLVK